MSDITLFENPEFGQVRVVDRDGEPWFVAKDVCDCLSLENPTASCDRLDEDEKQTVTREFDSNLFLGSKAQAMTLVSEPGLYSLVLRSNKPEAKLFKRWITHEVIPSIRKTGMYQMAPKTYAEALRALAAEVERKEKAEKERDEAIRTKYLFVEGRDAEMSGRVGGLTTQNRALRDAVGRGRNWQTISMREGEWVKRFGHKPSWQKLSGFSDEVGIKPIRDVEEKVVFKNGSEKVVHSYRYHKDAWARYERYEVLLRGEELL